jgi:hypothetical protein
VHTVISYFTTGLTTLHPSRQTQKPAWRRIDKIQDIDTLKIVNIAKLTKSSGKVLIHARIQIIFRENTINSFNFNYFLYYFNIFFKSLAGLGSPRPIYHAKKQSHSGTARIDKHCGLKEHAPYV